MRTSRKESSGGVLASRPPGTAARQAAMAEGPDAGRGTSVLHSQALLSLLGGECLQILRCRICMEFFTIPIVLPCGHTFCLHCLTEMCKHASRGVVPNSRHELLIGCPTCRVQIFAKPILERNVTCNFIIQSLVETLRNRKIPERHEVGVNTEQSHVGPCVRAVSQEELSGVLRDMDRLASAISSRSVVDDAFFQIENLRNEYLASETAVSPASSAVGDTPNLDRRQNNSTAVASDSVRTSASDTVRASSCSPNVQAQRTSAKTVCGPLAQSYASTLSSWPATTSSTYTSSLHTTVSQSGNLLYGDRNGNNVEMAKEFNSLDIIITSERKPMVECTDFMLLHGDHFVNSSKQSFTADRHRPLPFSPSISRHSSSGLLTKKDKDTRCFTSRAGVGIMCNCQYQDESTGLEEVWEKEPKSQPCSLIIRQELVSDVDKSEREKEVDSAVIQDLRGQTLALLELDVPRGRSREVNGRSYVFHSTARASSPCDWSTKGGDQGVFPKDEAVDGVLEDRLHECKRGEERRFVAALHCDCFPSSIFEVSAETRES